MGNEESQQQPGGPPGAVQQPPMGGQPRFGGPQPPGMRQMAPITRPTGPGPPGIMRGGPFPPQQQQQPVRQVGVQPWAEPPVQQPARFRGPGGAPPMMQQPVRPPPGGVPLGVAAPRPIGAVQQQQQQQLQLQQQKQREAAALAAAEEEAGLDLSDLSEAEKAKILSVMARAQDLDEDYERHKRAKDEPIPARLLCPLCQRADLATETNKMCGDCGKDFCQKCGTFVPGEGRRSVWVCNTCSNRRKQQQESGLTQGQKGVDPSHQQRKDETMSRMGQPFQQQQQQQLQQQTVNQQPSVSLIGGVTGVSGGGGVGGGFVSGSLIPSVASAGRGTIPRTVPLTALSQAPSNNVVNNNSWNSAQQQQTQQHQMMIQQVTQGGLQQQQLQQPQQLQPQQLQPQQLQQPQLLQPQQQQLLPPQQQQQKIQPRQQQLQTKDEWSDLSPILDVSPSFEAAEQELMEKCQQQQGTSSSIPRATSGTISGMLADFNKALGLAATPTLDEQRGLVPSPHQQQQQHPGGPTVLTTTGGAPPPVGTEMDQNQNLVQQQFQLQQQQLMIQQQQQVIAQQQQQLQQQMQHHQQMQQNTGTMQQQQEQQQATAVQQQQQHQHQQGVAAATTQQQSQPQTQRKVHRRLPQPTMDQMHAAIAAQTPKSKSTTRGGYQRPVSPVLSSSRTTSSSYDSGALLGVPIQQSLTATSPGITCVSPTPTRKDHHDSVERKVRRRLPPVPLDQEPATAPLLLRRRDRARTLSMGAMPLSASCGGPGWSTSSSATHRRTPQRTTSLDDGMSAAMTSTADLDFLQGLTSTTTDSYLRFLSSREFLGGLLGTSSTSTVAAATTTTSVLDSIPSSIGLSGTGGSLLVRRDLSAPHSLSSYLRGGVASHLLDPASSSRLPSYLVSLKQQLREGLGSVTDIHSRRRITDPDLSGLLSHWAAVPSTSDPLLLRSSTLSLPAGGGNRLATSGTTPTAASLRRSRHRRHASDTKLGTSSFLRDEGYTDDPLYRYKFTHPTSGMPFKSFEFESIDDHLRTDGGVYGSSPYVRGSSLLARGGAYQPRRSSLTDTMTLRDTSLASRSLDLRRYNRDMARLRRHTDIGLVSSALGLDPYGRTTIGGVGGGGGAWRERRTMRSWHPSPYVSSEDEDEREEKKAKIKAEIARRKERLLMQHDIRGGVYDDRLYSSPISLESGGSSRDELDEYHHLLRRHPAYTSTSYNRRQHHNSGGGSYLGYDRGWPPYCEWGEEELLPYDPPYDCFSPSELLAPMPILPDMPTRSRKLLHELQHYGGGGGGGGGGGEYSTRATSGSQQYHHHPDEEYGGRGVSSDERRPPPLAPSQSSMDRHPRKAQNTKGGQKYDFPVKRILLTRDPKDRSVSGNGLGMKVVGGKEIPGGRGEIGAYVARIYPGGVVETLGEVREGDQVLEWNGVSLTGKTYEEVQRIIASSGDEVEIVIRSDFNMLSSQRPPASSHHPHHQQPQQNHHPQQQQRLSRNEGGGRDGSGGGRWGEQGGGDGGGNFRRSGEGRNYDSPDYYHQTAAEEGGDRAMSPPGNRGHHRRGRQQRVVSPTHEKGDNAENKEKYRAENICGEIQLQVCHDSKVGILYVTIVRARNLVTSRDNSGLPDPYVICYLLPDRCFEHQRRTRYFSRCSRPEWKQTMVYPHVPLEELRRRHLEISVWNYDVNGPPEFLGEVIVDLKDASVIDEQSRWYKLHPHDPKKYPHSSHDPHQGSVKMARLNNPPHPTHKILFDDDVRKQHTA